MKKQNLSSNRRYNTWIFVQALGAPDLLVRIDPLDEENLKITSHFVNLTLDIMDFHSKPESVRVKRGILTWSIDDVRRMDMPGMLVLPGTSLSHKGIRVSSVLLARSEMRIMELANDYTRRQLIAVPS